MKERHIIWLPKFLAFLLFCSLHKRGFVKSVFLHLVSWKIDPVAIARLTFLMQPLFKDMHIAQVLEVFERRLT